MVLGEILYSSLVLKKAHPPLNFHMHSNSCYPCNVALFYEIIAFKLLAAENPLLISLYCVATFNRHEIIEFPAVLVSTRRCQMVAEFQSYIKPVINPSLTAFCTRLTGITQVLHFIVYRWITVNLQWTKLIVGDVWQFIRIFGLIDGQNSTL